MSTQDLDLAARILFYLYNGGCGPCGYHLPAAPLWRPILPSGGWVPIGTGWPRGPATATKNVYYKFYASICFIKAAILLIAE